MKRNEKFILQMMLLGGSIGLLKNGIEQLVEIKENQREEFDFQNFLYSGLKGGAIGGGGAFSFLAVKELVANHNFIESEFDVVDYLHNVLLSYEYDDNDKKLFNEGNKIKRFIYNSFKEKLLGRPIYQGSMVRQTYLSGFSDLDIMVKFKKRSFPSLEEMYFSTLNLFETKFHSSNLIKIRQQRHSIGVLIKIQGQKNCIDIVPMRRTNFEPGGNEYNLYENPLGYSKNPSRKKLNPKIQSDYGNNEKVKKRLIILLKVLKKTIKLPLKSILIKELVIKAFQMNNQLIFKPLDKKLFYIIKFIRDNITIIRVVSQDNSNNILTNNLTPKERSQIAKMLNEVLRNIEETPYYLKKYFPTKNELLK